MLRIVNFVSIFTAILAEPGQNVYWISDEDDLFANKHKTSDTKRILERFASKYLAFPLGEVGVGTTKIDEADRFDEDCAAVPDLIAGATAELLTSLVRRHGKLPENPMMIDDSISEKGQAIIDWFSMQRGALMKCGILASFRGPGHYSLGTWQIEESLVNQPDPLWFPSRN